MTSAQGLPCTDGGRTPYTQGSAGRKISNVSSCKSDLQVTWKECTGCSFKSGATSATNIEGGSGGQTREDAGGRARQASPPGWLARVFKSLRWAGCLGNLPQTTHPGRSSVAKCCSRTACLAFSGCVFKFSPRDSGSQPQIHRCPPVPCQRSSVARCFSLMCIKCWLPGSLSRDWNEGWESGI